MNFGTPNSIDEANIDLNFNVYPNPSKGNFVIENLNNHSYDLEITNVYGQQVLLELNINRLENKIDMSMLSSGVYTAKIKNNKSTYTTKLVIE